MNANNKKAIKTVLQCDSLPDTEFSNLLMFCRLTTVQQGGRFDLAAHPDQLVLLLDGECQYDLEGLTVDFTAPVACSALESLYGSVEARGTLIAKGPVQLLTIELARLRAWLAQAELNGTLMLPLMKLATSRSEAVAEAKRPDNLRREKDLLGEMDVPQQAYYGVQTLRAMHNFAITDIQLRHFPKLVIALAMVKKAAARANCKLGLLDDRRANAISEACDEIIAGKWHDHFMVDVIQGGAGTSTNMNANEVIANRALELMGYAKGDYHQLHPNNHVNLSQSTNDVYPTAIRLGILLSHDEYVKALSGLCYELKQKAVEFSDVVKMGRTQLQDAVPITLGQEFDAWYVTQKEDIEEAKDVLEYFREINLGATAIGTGINSDPEYSSLAIEELSHISGKELVRARNLIEATSDMGAFVTFSSVLKRNAVKLSKMCNDLRLLSSGPRAGLQEINLPPMQPGSSIMPGKVNPVIPEMVNQVAFQIIGNDITVTLAAEAGQLQLNVMEPVLAFNVLQSLRLQIRAINTLSAKCIRGITANRERCLDLVNNSIGIITALNPYIGYDNASRIAKQAVTNGESVRDLVLAEGLLSEAELNEVLSIDAMTAPRRMRKQAQTELLTNK
ncbi:aspartate ammonia-lyase [Marinobacterium mangrovicola]|uniref:Aspartate ammonia-lyase n=1 Tax=Marinobacterium mangrovicola TaxID=1476959 RepID=A0A4R1GX21_9GAMM|nr:aspartate ammonia-lyase [Marinobacterium mangrovicola]